MRKKPKKQPHDTKSDVENESIKNRSVAMEIPEIGMKCETVLQ